MLNKTEQGIINSWKKYARVEEWAFNGMPYKSHACWCSYKYWIHRTEEEYHAVMIEVHYDRKTCSYTRKIYMAAPGETGFSYVGKSLKTCTENNAKLISFLEQCMLERTLASKSTEKDGQTSKKSARL